MVTVHCPRCHSDEVYRHGRRSSQHHRFRCRSCKRVFQLTCTCEAQKPDVKQQIVDMAFNGTGVRNSGLLLAAKPGNTGSGTPFSGVLPACRICNTYNTKTGGVLAYTFGPRNDETCRELLALLTSFNIGMITRDDCGSYTREVPATTSQQKKVCLYSRKNKL